MLYKCPVLTYSGAALSHSTHSVTGYLEEEISSFLSTSPGQEAMESNEVACHPPILKTRQTCSP